MKRSLISLVLVLAALNLASAQDNSKLLSSCLTQTGADSKYLKDFRIQLGTAADPGAPRYKAQMSLWKNTKYRFTMCNSDNSKGKLILTITDAADKVVLSSYDSKTGKYYPFVDFECNRSGIYTLSYDFLNGQKGSGVGIVSMVR
ncbi:MAG: hypothetical protein MUD02_03335 [Bacteroidales bacterium]|jgi:hypothetical protein|nr:hypothetical protein [Bacteroidales bacterium]MCU0407961.1 hypothetical protein [Bacteroidales bacterium]